jgi:L-alanine-DL-glutamate epimerase-like enolase superfamily enzyme
MPARMILTECETVYELRRRNLLISRAFDRDLRFHSRLRTSVVSQKNMKITRAESFMLKVPIQREIADGMQATKVLEFVGINISTDEGITGTGYTITVGAGVASEVLDSLFVDQLKGKDPFNVKEIWYQLYYGKSHWIGRASATTMAQSAVDIALWDIIAKSAERPLWQILGGCRSMDIPTYNTNAGWLNRTQDELQDEMLALLAEGYTALKMKVGKPDPREDYRRVKAAHIDGTHRWGQALHFASLSRPTRQA